MDSYIDGVPRLFAVMDDQPRVTYSSRPVHERRYKIILLDPENAALLSRPAPTHYILKEYSPRPTDLTTNGTIPMTTESKPWRPGQLKIRMRPTRDWRSDWMYVWETDYTIYIRSLDMWIPVLDTADRTAGIWNTPFKDTVHNDTPAMYEMRVIVQQELRETMLKTSAYLPDSPRPQTRWRPAPSPAPNPQPSAPPVAVTPIPVLSQTTRAPIRATTPNPVSGAVPPFVAAALKRDAVSKGESCPISLTPFEDCEAVALTPCYHLFEAAALKGWLQMRTTCPICKQPCGATLITVTSSA